MVEEIILVYRMAALCSMVLGLAATTVNEASTPITSPLPVNETGGGHNNVADERAGKNRDSSANFISLAGDAGDLVL